MPSINVEFDVPAGHRISSVKMLSAGHKWNKVNVPRPGKDGMVRLSLARRLEPGEGTAVIVEVG